jgi:cytochrome b subunit of formate dehydrogenase
VLPVVTTAKTRKVAAATGHGASGDERHYQRFDRYHRTTHVLLITSFLGLAFSGLPLRFSDQAWAATLARFLGGFEAAGLIHRFCAILMIGLFVAHIARIVHQVYVLKDFTALWGPSSMVPQPRDLGEMVAHLRYFVGLGPRPRFDHFTYWEKFDYWAVFWGMFIIGGSGLMLWFPTFFAKFVPGWMFNIAMLIHGEEALLAVGFIFTIHFFNGHLRPEKFPMDLVIFTGRLPEHELKDERSVEYARLVEQGGLAAIEAPTPTAEAVLFSRILGSIGLVLGVITIVLIIFSVVT